MARPTRPSLASLAGLLALLLLLAAAALDGVGAFAPPAGVAGRHRTPTPSSSTSTLAAASSPDVVVISPPGGIGELASVSAAKLGGSVKWFVVSAPAPTNAAAAASAGTAVSLTAETLAAIEAAGGSMELAGAAADALLTPPGEKGSGDDDALNAMAAWCSRPKGVIATYDGAAEEKKRADRAKTAEQRENSNLNEEETIKSGIRVAVQEAARGTARRVAVLGAGEETSAGEGEEATSGGGGGLFGALFGGDAVQIPNSLAEAMGGARGTAVVRHGELFGAPESSPESSPFMGGPRRDPVVRDMYTLRSVRIDPTVSASGNVLSGDGASKSNRLTVAEAASRLGMGHIDGGDGMDVALSSFAGTESPTDEEWSAEFQRATEARSNPAGGARLFSADFASVPSTKRLAEWLATKWAPAILRSYDIAGTRVGARPVCAVQSSDTTVEIVWQQLVDFTSVTSGKMIIEVSEMGMAATRGAGDVARGFGRVSSTPLPGEDLLVRRLGDAASQAVEKGLAVKPRLTKKAAKAPVVVVAAPEPVAAAASSGNAPAAGAADSGPRGAGARRSSERSRGSRRRKSPPPTGGES
ncbi:hypothetical protein ACHAXT_009671 [Thalassiosira profunda]